MAGKKSGRGRGRRMRRGGRRRAFASAKRLGKSEFASAKQTIDMPADMVNIVYHLNDINLSQFDRLLTLGRCYQYFRFTKIEVKFKPFSDTYIQQNNASVPNLYYVVNKSDTLDIGTFNQMKDAGAKARRFDDRNITVSWKPVVSQGVINEQTATGVLPTAVAWASYRTSPWLSTDASPSDGTVAWNPSTVPHKGLLYGVEQDVTAQAQAYGIEVTVHAQFKKPLTMLPLGGVYHAPVRKIVQDKTELATNPPV